jgi:uncharacterized protein (DUF924 family)
MTPENEMGAMPPEVVLSFWLDELKEADWYSGGEALDNDIRLRFGAALEHARNGGFESWLTSAQGALAYLILTDQMSRNIHRGTALAYAADGLARAVAVMSIGFGWDLKTAEPERQFFYMPLEHSECLSDQDRAVRLMLDRLTNTKDHLLHARAHREIIRRFGRFPTRNEHLGRTNTPAEASFLSQGGYRAVVDGLKLAA